MLVQSLVSAFLLAELSGAVADGTTNCRALTAQATDEWCTSNCNNAVPFCPPEFCQCGTAPSPPSPPTPSPLSTTAGPPTPSPPSPPTPPPTPSPLSTTAGLIGTCRTLTAQATDQWCTANCNNAVPFCPPELCQCSTPPTPVPASTSSGFLSTSIQSATITTTRIADVITTTTVADVATTPTTTVVGSATTTTTVGTEFDKCTAENLGCPEPNGKGISAWFTKDMFDKMFPQICNPNCKGCSLLTYNCLIQATLLYPEFANSGSDAENRRELAAWLGIMSQETTGGGCSLSKQKSDGSCTCGPMWCDESSPDDGGCEAWGLCKLAEETTDAYCSHHVDYPCVAGKKYSGRGPKQLSWNANYGQFSEEFCGDKNVLLNHPERLATNPTLAWASSIWFWFSGGACVKGESCKPGCHSVMLAKKSKCPADVAAGRQYGLGWATNVVNGGLECGSSGNGKCDFRVHSRVKYYKRFCSLLGVTPLAPGWTEAANLFCHTQKNYNESPATEC